MGGNFDAYKVSKYLMGKNDILKTIIVTGFEKNLASMHTIAISKLSISPEMDYWLNALSYSTVCLAPK